MLSLVPIPLLFLLLGLPSTFAFVTTSRPISLYHTVLSCHDRRRFLREAAILPTVLSTIISINEAAYAVERAVGSAERSCREEGNCLQKGDLDGAVGWNWGGRDRCDANDPLCGPNGVLLDEIPSGLPVPQNNDANLKITDIIEINLVIGKTEKGTLRLGFYGDACRESVNQILDFLGDSDRRNDGLAYTSKLMMEDGLGVVTAPVSLTKSGILGSIVPQRLVSFGVPSQRFAFAASRKMTKAGDNFVPQPRSSGAILNNVAQENSARLHDAAGLISISKNGIGYGGSSFDSEDEAYSNAFQITANSNNPSMDKDGMKVVGQLLDDSSMTLLQRLSSLPTKKGFKGIIPGQDAGPPLLKVTVASVYPEQRNDSQ